MKAVKIRRVLKKFLNIFVKFDFFLPVIQLTVRTRAISVLFSQNFKKSRLCKIENFRTMIFYDFKYGPNAKTMRRSTSFGFCGYEAPLSLILCLEWFNETAFLDFGMKAKHRILHDHFSREALKSLDATRFDKSTKIKVVSTFGKKRPRNMQLRSFKNKTLHLFGRSWN